MAIHQRHRSAQEIIDLDQQHVWHPYASMPNTLPSLPIRSAQGCLLHPVDASGTNYPNALVDGMSSWWAAIHGYNHPILNQAARQQLSRMSHVMFGGLTHGPAVELAELLVDMTPGDLNKIFYCDSGSVAIEVAMKMAIQFQYNLGHVERTKFVTIRGGYHGDTFHAMSVCDPVNGMHHLFAKSLAPQIFVDRPECKLGEDWNPDDVLPLRRALEDHADHVAAVILEPIVQGAGGMRFYHPQYLKEARALCDEFQVLLIADEIATGFGRSGEMFACQHASSVVPDILCIGKALSGGMMSFAATITTSKVSKVFANGGPTTTAAAGVLMHGPTFMGNPLACAVSAANLQLLQSYDWQAKVQGIHKQLQAELEAAKESSLVQNVRTCGAIGVIEMKEPMNMKDVQPWLIQQGVWLRPFGKLLYTMPPYIISKEQLRKITQVMVQLAFRR